MCTTWRHFGIEANYYVKWLNHNLRIIIYNKEHGKGQGRGQWQGQGKCGDKGKGRAGVNVGSGQGYLQGQREGKEKG